jgi:hypothetical protein
MGAFPPASLRTSVAFCASVAALSGPATSRAASDPSAAPIDVRHREGELHGFLVLRDLAGRDLAAGELLQNVDGDRVSVRVVFRFHDGSISDETVVYSQKDTFKVLRDRLTQKGQFFRRALELDIDGESGEVTVHSVERGKEKVYREHIDLPPNLVNGIVPIVLKNVDERSQTTLSMIVATPKPLLVTLIVRPGPEMPFSFAGTRRNAREFVLHVELGGAKGVFASLLGKRPPDSHVWIVGGPAPVFVRAQQPFFADGPEVRIELVGPHWPH